MQNFFQRYVLHAASAVKLKHALRNGKCLQGIHRDLKFGWLQGLVRVGRTAGAGTISKFMGSGLTQHVSPLPGEIDAPPQQHWLPISVPSTPGGWRHSA